MVLVAGGPGFGWSFILVLTSLGRPDWAHLGQLAWLVRFDHQRPPELMLRLCRRNTEVSTIVR